MHERRVGALNGATECCRSKKLKKIRSLSSPHALPGESAEHSTWAGAENWLVSIPRSAYVSRKNDAALFSCKCLCPCVSVRINMLEGERAHLRHNKEKGTDESTHACSRSK